MERRTLEESVVQSIGLAALLWSPLLLFEVLTSYPWSHVAAASVLRRCFALATVLWLAIAVTVGIWARLSSLAIGGRTQGRSAVASRVLLELAIAALSSALLLSVNPSIHGWVARRYWPPEVGLAIAVVLSCILASLVVGSVLTVARGRWLGVVSIASCLAALGYWLTTVVGVHPAAAQPLARAILASNAIALIAIVGRQAALRSLGRLSRAGFVWVAVVLGAAAPLAMLIGSDPSVGRSRQSNQAGTSGGRSNVLVILVDTLRADHTTLGGYPLETTPELQRIAAEGATYFSQAVSASSHTIPSVRALFTASPASHSGAAPMDRLPPGMWTMARTFKAAGYRTGALSANGLIDGPGFRAGFDDFWAFGGNYYYQKSFLLFHLLSGENLWVAFRRVARLHLHKEKAPDIRARVRRWLEQDDSKPFFLYVHLVDPHWPYYDRGLGMVPEELTDLDQPLSHVDLLLLRSGNPAHAAYRSKPELRELVGRYDDEIRLADRFIGDVIEDLDNMGMDDSTLIVVLGDHGEEFFEHNGFGHGHDVYEEQVHVPLLFRWPNEPGFRSLPPRVDVVVSLIDVMPTLVDYLRLPPLPATATGLSLRPFLEGRGAGIQRPAASEAVTRTVGYREGEIKVRLEYPQDAQSRLKGNSFVYDLVDDPEETRPLSASDPRTRSVVARAQAYVEGHIRRRGYIRMPAPRAAAKPPVSPDKEALERLRALGYVE